jgi:hypothetical protein
VNAQVCCTTELECTGLFVVREVVVYKDLLYSEIVHNGSTKDGVSG